MHFDIARVSKCFYKQAHHTRSRYLSALRIAL